MKGTTRGRVTAGMIVALLVGAAGCARPVPVPPQALEDARLVARVKTVLVNDDQLGTRVIEVRVDQGVATLSGLVASQAELTRAVDLARAVPGVVDVVSRLVVGEPATVPAPLVPPPDPAAASMVRRDLPPPAERRLLAVGGTLSMRRPSSNDLATTFTAGPMVRIGQGRGLGLAIGFSWFDADVTNGATSGDLGRISIRPLMAGLGYTFTDQVRWSLAASLVGGFALNNVDIQERQVREGQVLDVDNSLVARPGLSLWYDINSRAAVNVFGGYVITRPQTTFLERGAFTRRTVHADTAVVSVGLAYKLF